MTIERWPPVYDAEGLARQIRELAERDKLLSAFYLPMAVPAPQDRCQGDVIAFHSPVPLIDADGEVVGMGEVEHWLLISNSCDLDRSLDEVAWAQLIPIDVLGVLQLQPEQRAALKGYQTSRRFFVPT
jgi:hypothetical protein